MCSTERIYDYKAQNIDFIRSAIQKRVDEGITRFAILPMGFWGKEACTLLKQEFQLKEQMCFDNFMFNNHDIHPVDAVKTMDLSDVAVLIVVENEEHRSYLYQQIAAYVSDTLIELIPLYDAEKKKIFEESEKVHLDFLCAGFHKCSTTSLQKALQQNVNVYLPDVKETFFAMSVTESNHKKLKQSYLDKGNKGLGVLCGGIEPTYPPHPSSVYRYFGSDLKILFLVRNPIEALQSAFKMSMREMDGRGFELIQKYKKICPELINTYIETDYKRFIYIDFIRMYERYYPKIQIKIVLAEELIQNPAEQMDAIQEFIGLASELRIKYEDFPHENKGDRVIKDLGSAYVNNALNILRMHVEDVSLYLNIDAIRRKVFDITTDNFDFEQYSDIWEEAKLRYVDSIRALERRIGRSLEGIWY